DPFGGGGSGCRATSGSSGGGNYLARGVGGVIGFGLIGAGLSQVSRPLGIAFGAIGAARSVYKNILGKGQELRFQADTPIQLQLAPGPQSAQSRSDLPPQPAWLPGLPGPRRRAPPRRSSPRFMRRRGSSSCARP